jgi:site-specific recombinase XerD
VHTTFKRFESELARQDKSAATQRGYLSDLRDFAAWVEQTYGEPFDPRRLVREDVRAYRSHLLTVRRQKPATINRKLASLGSFCRWAVAEGLLESDPSTGVEGVSQVQPPPRALEKADLNRLIRRTQQEGNALHIAVVTMLAYTGLRAAELCGVQKADVEMSERKGAVTVRGKGEKYRTVPLNAETRRALQAYLKVRPATRKDEGAVFIGQRGALTESGAWRIVAKYADLAGLADVSPHVLRHTFATRLLRDAEADVVTVANLMGHADVRTTARYTTPTQADLEQAVEALA